MVVDFLAKHGANGGNLNFIGEDVGSGRLRNFSRMDKLGIPHIRH